MPASSSCRRSRSFRPEKWDAIIAINLSSAFHAIRAAVPGMKKRGWGRIINTASAHSLVASPFKSAYVSAKHGIAGLTKTVALELATFKITCNCISPGYVWTPLVEKQIPETMKARNMTKEQVIKDVLLDAQPTKEFVTSEQVAALALFLCGDDAAQITGANLLDRRRLDRGVGIANGSRERAALVGGAPGQRAAMLAVDRCNSLKPSLPATRIRTVASSSLSTVSGTRTAQ